MFLIFRSGLSAMAMVFSEKKQYRNRNGLGICSRLFESVVGFAIF